jgi:TonB-dependent starch-binding outer membrane protein SusC
MRNILRIMLAALLCTSLNAWAQTGVTGKVTTATGETLPGVNVLLKGTNKGTITDSDGAFALDATQGTLVFSFIGYKPMEVAIDGRSTVDVSMEEDVTTLEQVVVVGYGTQRRKDITTAVVTVDESSIADRPMVSAAEALQGKAAGVQIVSPSGKPGGDISVRVRGATSVLAGNEPLYVVDGVPTTDIRGLNPNDIASMSVLKDAASASIYGARAANGVVIITTKRGRSNEPVIRLNAYTGFQNLRKTIDVLNTDQYRDLMEEVLGAGSVDPTITRNANWSDEVFGTGKIQSYQLSFSGGNENTRYMVSGNYLGNEGIVKPATFNRYSIRMNLDNDVKDWLKIGTSLNFLSSKTKDTPDNLSSGRGGVIMSALNTPPFLEVYNPDGSGEFAPNPFAPSWENPIAYMYGPDQEALDNRLFGNVSAEAKIIEGLTFRSNLGIDMNIHQWDYYLDPSRTVFGRQQNGVGRSDKTNSTTWLWENTLNYAKTIGKNNFSVLAGTSVQEYNSNNSYLSGNDFPSDASVKTINAANTITGSTGINEWSLASLFGRATYDYDGRYLLTASVRRDGSSKLANRWGTMPSFSAGWRISSESFMQDVTAINDLKLRVGYGVNGNQEGIGNYVQYGLINYIRRQPTTPLSGPATQQVSYGNPDLKWETTTQTNFGIDLSVLESHLNFTFDAYIKKTDDLLLDVQLGSGAGDITSIQTNAGALENKGIELNISSINVDKQSFRWNTDFNISFNRNKVTDLQLTDVYYYGRIYSNNQDVAIVREGLPLGSFFGYVAEGVNPQTGDIDFADRNGNGILDPDDRTVIGSAQPKFVYGLTNTLGYKRFDLNIFFQGSYGNDIYNATRVDLEGMFDSKNQSTAVLNRWTPENTNTSVPRAGNINNSRNSTRFVEDGSYLRLKQVTLSYNFSPDFLQKAGINKLSLYTTGQNLLTFTKYSGFDPEVNAFGRSATELGVDYGTYPQARTITFGVNVEF